MYSQLKSCRATLACALAVLLAVPVHAAESPLQIIMGKSKSVVAVQTLTTAVFGAKPQGIFDMATGQILFVKKIRQAAETRKGNGIIIGANGVIVVNTHTIQNAGGVFVTLFNGTRVQARVVHFVPDTDIAFLSIKPPFPLTPIEFADSDTAATDSEVFSINHSSWKDGSLSGGKIHALAHRKFSGVAHVTLIQVTFRSYYGDSGSPILDPSGKLLGMINAGQARDNLTYAIASNFIRAGYRSYADSLKTA